MMKLSLSLPPFIPPSLSPRNCNAGMLFECPCSQNEVLVCVHVCIRRFNSTCVEFLPCEVQSVALKGFTELFVGNFSSLFWLVDFFPV